MSELLLRSRKELCEAESGSSCSPFRALVLEWVQGFNLLRTVYKGPFVMTSSLDAGSWQLATTVP